MGVADISKTTFGNNPRKGVETIDAYDGDKISSLISDLGGVVDPSLSKLYPDIKADQIQALATKGSTQDFLVAKNMSFGDLVKSVTKSLPPGVKLSDILSGDVGLEKILDFADRLRAKMTSGQWAALDSDFFTSIYNTYERYTTSFGKGGDWAQYVKNLSIAGLNGLLDDTGFTVDELLDVAQRLGITEKLLASGYTEDFIGWVADSNLPDPIKEMIYKDLLDMAAANGLTSEIKQLIALAKAKNDPWRARKTIQLILGGYRLPAGTSVSQYANLATELIADCDNLVNGWHSLDGQSHTLYFTMASNDALRVLMHNPITQPAAVTVTGFRPAVTSWRYKAKESFPFLYV